MELSGTGTEARNVCRVKNQTMLCAKATCQKRQLSLPDPRRCFCGLVGGVELEAPTVPRM